MKIIDLEKQYEQLYFCCLEDWSEDMEDAGDHKQKWYNTMKAKGVRVKLAVDDHGEIGGMIQYIPTEYSFVQGSDLYIVYCIWVHGHKQGRGDFRKRGMGKALIQAAEQDVKNLGAKGLVVWGLSIPVFMRASWFKKQGYKKIDKQGIQVLLWKPFTEDAVAPYWIKQKKKPETVADKVTVTAFINGWCPVQNMIAERAKRAAKEFGEKVVFKEISTLDRDTFLEYGLTDAVYINDKLITKGPPIPYKKIKKKIAKRVRKL